MRAFHQDWEIFQTPSGIFAAGKFLPTPSGEFEARVRLPAGLLESAGGDRADSGRLATGSIAAELGFGRLDRQALGHFARLCHRVSPLAALDLLEKLRWWRCRQEDFAAVVKKFEPGNTLELQARLALRKLLGLPPKQLQL